MSEAQPPQSVARFSGLAEMYDRYRPSYPAEAIAAILEGLAIQPTVIDVGAGTGISTSALAAAGAHTIAIEPNAEMRAVALARGLDAREGTAVATGLADRCADAVTAFQAFHWFANEKALMELRRLLRPGGRIALVWNERDQSDPFTFEFRTLEERFGEKALLAGMGFADESLEPLLRASGFADVRRRLFANQQILDADRLLGRVRSSSYAPRRGPALEDLSAALCELHARYAGPEGTVALRYQTEVTMGDIVSR